MDRSSKITTIIMVVIVFILAGILWYRSHRVQGWIYAVSHQTATQNAVEAAKELVLRKKIVKVFKKRPIQAKENSTEVLELLATLEPRDKVGKRSAEYLVEMLEDVDVPIRVAAKESLGHLGTVAVKYLLEDGLTNADKDVRMNSTAALVSIGFAAIPDLIRVLETGAPSVREGAAIALGEMQSERAIPPLIAATGIVDQEDTRLAAKEALIKIGPPAVAQLIAALEDANHLIRMNAADALGEIRDPRANPPLLAHLEKDAHRLVRIAAAYALGKIGKKESVPLLMAVLAEEDKDLREGAAVSLGLLKDGRAVQPLGTLLDDDTWAVREQAAEALGRIGAADPKGAGATARILLEAKLASNQAGTREAAALALGRLADPQAEPALQKALADPSAAVRQRVAWALGETRSPAAVAPLIAALQDKDWRVTYAVRDALARIGAPAIEPLLATFTGEDALVARYAGQALGRMDPPPIERLKQALTSTQEKDRLYAALALGDIASPEALEALETVQAKDRSKKVQRVARRALNRARPAEE